MEIFQSIRLELKKYASEEQASTLKRFFKTGKGEYGEGDKFYGVRVPQTRNIIKNFRRNASLSDIDTLIKSEWHEERLAGFLLLIEIYQHHKKENEYVNQIIQFYIDHIQCGNNWDLVDLVAPKILGDWLITNHAQRHILYKLAISTSLWERRVAIVATLSLIRQFEFDDTEQISITLLSDRHDLIHKAIGWMLREIGKRDEQRLIKFINNYGFQMARTTLRYAIERLSPELKTYFMHITKHQTIKTI